MPHFAFFFSPSQVGCVERLVVQTPWYQPAQGPNGQIMDPSALAWSYVLQQVQAGSLVLPENAQMKCTVTNPGGHSKVPVIYCIQTAIPQIDRAQVNAPFNSPVGSGRGLTEPPRQVPRNQVGSGGMYEDLSDCALASSADSILGEADGAAGTWSDLDSQGRETVRQMAVPPSPKVTDR